MMESPLEKFIATYRILTADNLHLLDTIYHEDIRFIDPAHTLCGREQLKTYFAALYAEVTAIDFAFTGTMAGTGEAYLRWDMTSAHPRINRGQPVVVTGVSYLQFDPDGRITLHQDYFDLGALLYEHLPLLGRIIKAIKRRLGS